LFFLSQTDGSSTFVGSLENGNDGEAIAYNPDDGYLYHYSGESFERIDFLGNTSIDTENFASDSTGEVLAATYAGMGSFLYSVDSFRLYRHTISTGDVTNLGGMDAVPKGLAFKDGKLYACDVLTNSIPTINENNGSTVTSKNITTSNETIVGCTGLATHPDTHELWALLRTPRTRP
jgi:hypothetical protein